MKAGWHSLVPILIDTLGYFKQQHQLKEYRRHSLPYNNAST